MFIRMSSGEENTRKEPRLWVESSRVGQSRKERVDKSRGERLTQMIRVAFKSLESNLKPQGREGTGGGQERSEAMEAILGET